MIKKLLILIFSIILMLSPGMAAEKNMTDNFDMTETDKASHDDEANYIKTVESFIISDNLNEAESECKKFIINYENNGKIAFRLRKLLVKIYGQENKWQEATDEGVKILNHLKEADNCSDFSTKEIHEFKFDIVKSILICEKSPELLSIIRSLSEKETDEDLRIAYMWALGEIEVEFHREIECFRLAYALSKARYGKYDKYTFECALKLADIYPILYVNKKDECLDIAKEACDIALNLYGENSYEYAVAMCKLGAIYSGYNDKKNSIELLNGSLDIIKKIKDMQNPKKVIGSRLDIQRELSFAYLTYDKEYDKEELTQELLNKLNKQSIDLAKKTLKESKKVFGETSDITLDIQENLARILFVKNDYKNAIKLLKPIIATRKNKIASELMSHEEYMLSYCYLMQRDYENAKDIFLREVSNTEQNRESLKNIVSKDRMDWFGKNSYIYKDAVKILTRAGDVDNALQVAELCKGRELTEVYSVQLANDLGSLTHEERQKNEILQSEIKECEFLIDDAIGKGDFSKKLMLESKRAAIIEEYQTFRSKLSNKYPQYRHVMELQNINAKRDRDILSNECCYISFFKIEEYDAESNGLGPNNRIVAFVASNKAVKAYDIPIGNVFYEGCRIYRDLLTYPALKSMQMDNKYFWRLADGYYWTTEGRKIPEAGAVLVKDNSEIVMYRQKLSEILGNILFKPILSDISNYSQWIISCDGELNFIPFETLTVDGKMIIDRADISYVPSLSVLRIMKERDKVNANHTYNNNLFVIGDAIYGTDNVELHRGSMQQMSRSMDEGKFDLSKLKWNNLPGTGREIDKVSGLFNDSKILRKDEASESNVKQLNNLGKLSDYKYLLFATHGIFVPTAPELSSIVLNQVSLDAENDGYITVGEWMGYTLNSDIVYLSACETGLGKYQDGEGVVGIPYALCIAGNKDTVMSLWKIADEPAADFSATFFSKLKKGKSAVKAINETKREFMRNDNPQYSDPSVWSAFVLYGI